MTDVRDPEFDEPPQTIPGVCPRGRCNGSGWIQVSEAYVDSHAPWPSISLPDDPTEMEQATYDAVMRHASLTRAGHRQSSYPCPVCLAGPFHRWNGGHWANHHNRIECGECWLIDFPSRGRRARTPKEVPTHVEPEPVYSEPEPDPEPARRLDLD